jgi:glycosyltransferase involved in cell wall biosynthesis
MNVCMLADKPLPAERPTGIGVAAYSMALALARRGVAVHYICRGEEDRTTEVNPRLSVQAIKHFSRDNLASSLSVIRQGGCQLMHVHSSSAVPSLVGAWALRKPTIFHSHSDQPLHPLGLTLVRNVEMGLSRRVITVSRSTRAELMRNHHLPGGKVSVAYNGVDPDEFRPSASVPTILRKYGLEGCDRMILSIGTLQKKKGQSTMIECLPRILKSWPRLLYVNAGSSNDRDYRSRLLARADELGVSRAVRLLPLLPRDELVGVINAADLCVHLSTQEAFGLAVVEEMACSKAVIAFDSCAMPEIIDDRVNGFLVRPGSREDLIASILDALSDPNMAKRLGGAARAKVLAKFTWDQTASRLEVIFGDVLS